MNGLRFQGTDEGGDGNPSVSINNILRTDYRDVFMREIREGLSGCQKIIPSKYFYDEDGCRLFEQICCTPEYYLTKTEFSILEEFAAEIMSFFVADGGDLIELGSGSNKKIRKLLDRSDLKDFSKIRYVPVDINESSIRKSCGELIKLYEKIRVLGIVADFTKHLEALPRGRKMILFLGSTLGNLPEQEVIEFLVRISDIMTHEDRFLLGLDMVKPAEIMETAYNDGLGWTEKFNLNILSNINRELHADFDMDDFSHLAFFNEEKERIEMHLEAKRALKVHISDLSLTVDFRKGERVHTEICCKFSRSRARRLFEKTGLSDTEWFTDTKEWFSIVELKAIL